MTSGKKESDKRLSDVSRVSDFIPSGDVTRALPTIKSIIGKEVTIKSLVGDTMLPTAPVPLGVNIEVSGLETLYTIPYKRIIEKLWHLRDKLPLNARFTKGARYYDVE